MGSESEHESENIELFYHNEVIRGRLLGKGSFADVYEVEEFKPLEENNKNFDEARIHLRRSYSHNQDDEDEDESNSISTANEESIEITSKLHKGSRHSRRHDQLNKKKQQFAIKCLRENLDDPKMFKLAARDMKMEATLLSKLQHPHIIQVYATSPTGVLNGSGGEAGTGAAAAAEAKDLFIVVDRLTSTLDNKIGYWRREKQRIATAPSFFQDHRALALKKQQFFVERLCVARDVADAVAYLHSRHIVFRDLKADNVGFDGAGKTKIFDFGLARQMPKKKNKKKEEEEENSTTTTTTENDSNKPKMNDTYKMSGKTGNLMLMAPEVWKEEPYNEKADVHSFAVLLWIMLTLELPYMDLMAGGKEEFTQKIFYKGTRPPIFESEWPPKIQTLLRQAWAENMDDRPNMEEVFTVIKQVIADEQGVVDSHKNNANNAATTMTSTFWTLFVVFLGWFWNVFGTYVLKHVESNTECSKKSMQPKAEAIENV